MHTAASTRKWMADHGVRQFNGGIWPPNSPDMNPIEHVWPLVTRQLTGRIFTSRDDLWTELVLAFGRVTPAQIQSLYASMPRMVVTQLLNTPQALLAPCRKSPASPWPIACSPAPPHCTPTVQDCKSIGRGRTRGVRRLMLTKRTKTFAHDCTS